MQIIWNVDFTKNKLSASEITKLLCDSFNKLDKNARPVEIRIPVNALQNGLVDWLQDKNLPVVGYRETKHAA